MIYSPLTAVTDVVKNPKYKGPIMILLLFVLANTCFFYIALSKTFLEDIQHALASFQSYPELLVTTISPTS